MRNSIIVVEGTHDVSKVVSVYKNANCVITNGREISEQTLNMIKDLSKDNDIILFLDPDGPGELIRKKVQEVVPNALHAFLPKNVCISNNKRKVGIEHASEDSIRKALENVYKPTTQTSPITISDIYDLKLIGYKDSKINRDKISKKLNIGAPNGKTFVKRLNLFGISLNKLKELAK